VKDEKNTLSLQQAATLRFLLVGVTVFNLLDYLLTLFFLQAGFRELNPIISPLVHTPYFPFLKLVIIPLLLCFIWRVRQSLNGRRIMFYARILFGAYLLLMVYFSYNLSLLRL